MRAISASMPSRLAWKARAGVERCSVFDDWPSRRRDSSSCGEVCRQIGLPQFDLAQFAGRRHRHLVEDAHQFWHLEAAEMLSAMLRYAGFIRGRARFQLDEGGHRLAPLRMRQAHYGGVLHGGMGEQRLLDLHRSDILAAGLDHVLLAVDEQHFAVLIDQGEISGMMPAEFARLFGRLRDPCSSPSSRSARNAPARRFRRAATDCRYHP